MKELEQAVTAAFAKMAESGAVQKIIEDQIACTVKEVIRDALQSYSQFGKALKEQVSTQLAVDFSKLGLGEYNAEILRVIKTKLDASVCRFAEKEFGEQLEELLQSAPAEIKLSELVTQLRQHAEEEGERDVRCEVKQTSGLSGYTQVELKTKKYGYDNEIRLCATDKGEIFSLSFPHKGDVTKRIFAGRFYGFERTLYQLWCAKTKLIVDEAAL